MLYGHREIPSLDHFELIKAYQDCVIAENKREAASQHEKFNTDREINNRTIKKINLPPINPKFLELKQALIAEMKQRKLDIEL